jgi:hypothetical protein
MAHQFKKHYTREEAQALLPQIRQWLATMAACRDKLMRADEEITRLLGFGDDLGGKLINDSIRTQVTFQQVLKEFVTREIQIKDVDRGLLDFPSFVAGKEVFLCWEKSEDTIEFWHDLETGFPGREPL